MTAQDRATLVLLAHELVGWAFFTVVTATIAATLLWDWFDARRRRKDIQDK